MPKASHIEGTPGVLLAKLAVVRFRCAFCEASGYGLQVMLGKLSRAAVWPYDVASHDGHVSASLVVWGDCEARRPASFSGCRHLGIAACSLQMPAKQGLAQVCCIHLVFGGVGGLVLGDRGVPNHQLPGECGAEAS